MIRLSGRFVSWVSVAGVILACGSGSSKTGTPSSSASPPAQPGTSSSGGSSGASSGSSGTGAGSSSGAAAGNTSSSGGASTGPVADASSGLDATSPSGDAMPDSSVSTGVLPPVSDPGAPGPFTPVETDNTGPNGQYTIIAPMELGQGGIENPILVWSPGAGADPAIYQTLLDHIASHGFLVISYNSTSTGPELTTAIDWIVSQGTMQGSPYYNKIDITKIAAGGQSAGSLAAFNIAGDKRLTTTLHINGGTFAPHTGVMNLVKPAQFICGDDPDGGNGLSQGDLARPNCDADFQLATTPVWYGDVIGATHVTIIDNPLSPTPNDPLKKPFLSATTAWLRWQLAGDQTMKPSFVGSSCGYCQETSTWTVQQKNLQ
jgi:hypothetical protein